ncbi:hypothetical protein [Streptomyces sp. NPDC087272]|uniref:hypothetical protein n=1 Tax=Streptomyces sp. NPDC087272 TaxID=3365775 RepID=UPI00382088EF
MSGAYRLPGGRQITGALSVKFGRRARSGQWIEEPAAKYECLLCVTSVMVTGAGPVAAFVETIRTTHPESCPGFPVDQKCPDLAA